MRVWELVAPKHDTVGLGHVAAPTGPTSYRMPGRRAAEMALARHRYDRGPAASAPRPGGGVAFVRPAAFGVELNEEDSGPSDLPPAPAPYELRPAAPKKRRASSNKRVGFPVLFYRPKITVTRDLIRGATAASGRCGLLLLVWSACWSWTCISFMCSSFSSNFLRRSASTARRVAGRDATWSSKASYSHEMRRHGADRRRTCSHARWGLRCPAS